MTEPTVTRIASFSGGDFEAVIDTEPDGSLSILTAYRPGYGSAHLAYVSQRYPGAIKEYEQPYRVATGAVRVLTVWRPAA